MHHDGPPEQFAFWLFNDAMRLEADACGLSIEDFSNAINHLIAEGLSLIHISFKLIGHISSN